MKAARLNAPVAEKKEYGCATELVVKASSMGGAEPGQFLHVYCGSRDGMILRRPFSIFAVDGENISFLVKDVGKGSAWLREREVGDVLDIMGPLGKGFSCARKGRNILVAGGAGIAPLHFLAVYMGGKGEDAVLLWGMEKKEDYGDLPDAIGKLVDLRLSSMDGSLGMRGSVLDLFEAVCQEKCPGLYACGPRAMLLGLAEKASARGSEVYQVSIEERMACGLGACRGCAVPRSMHGGGYLAVCSDGPVFDAKELDWKKMRDSSWT
ncbi:MAG: dihydroorotate dehydrogenase electron transfer subunit [Actinomycetota bacterium]